MPATAILITLEMAKAQLKITDTTRDAELAWKMAQAEDVIVRYCKPKLTDEDRDPPWPWTIETVPPAVQDAILLYLGHLDQHRGDDLKDNDDRVWAAIANRLAMIRDKALA